MNGYTDGNEWCPWKYFGFLNYRKYFHNGSFLARNEKHFTFEEGYM